MADKDTPKQSTELPEPESLATQPDDGSQAPKVAVAEIAAKKRAKSGAPRRMTYRPSHKATFIGIGIVIAVLAVNAGVIWFIIQSQSAEKEVDRTSVTLSSETLDSLGVTRNDTGKSAEELLIGPNTTFAGTLTVAEKTSLSGELVLNNKLTAQNATLTKLDAGETSVSTLNINGDATATTLNLRQDLNVAGATRLQGAVTVGQILTVTGGLNVGGNVAVNGTLSVNSLQVNNLALNSSLTIGGRIISSGSAPNVGTGSGSGSNGSVSISGNDTAGTVVANVGVGGGNGTIVQVAFRSAYGNTPRVIISPVGTGVPYAYVNRSAGGFSIAVNGALAPGGYVFDYVVIQ